jgi:hypothetical protein
VNKVWFSCSTVLDKLIDLLNLGRAFLDVVYTISQSVTGLGKGVLCSRELSAIGKTVAVNFEDRARGIDELKNRSGKCEGSGGGDRRVKEPEWEM